MTHFLLGKRLPEEICRLNLRSHYKTGFFVILNEVKDLNPLKI